MRWLATIEADIFRGFWIDPNARKVPFDAYTTRLVAERPVRPRRGWIYKGQLRHIVAVFAKVDLCHNAVARIYRLFRSITTTAVDGA